MWSLPRRCLAESLVQCNVQAKCLPTVHSVREQSKLCTVFRPKTQMRSSSSFYNRKFARSKYPVSTSIRPVAVQTEPTPDPKKKVSLIIFDKDGTLICFHSMWTPWALATAEKIRASTGLENVDIVNEVYRLLGFCPIEQKVQPGLLAEATMPEIKEKVIDLLTVHGLEKKEATDVVKSVWEDCDTSNPDNLKTIYNIRHLFETLKEHDVKIAICTADSRGGTVPVLEQLGLMDMIDVIVCGDDAGTEPKPSPHNAWKICETLGVDPKEAFMVGDTLADVKMGQSAELGGSVAVLSGVATEQQLSPYSDHVVAHVGELIPLLLKKHKKKTARHWNVLGKSFGYFPTIFDSASLGPVVRGFQDYLNNKFGTPTPSTAGNLVKCIRNGVRYNWRPANIYTRTSRFLHTHSCQVQSKRTLLTPNPSKMEFPANMEPKPTHIIIGAGSAGCVLANRLSENPDNNVLLLEFGPKDEWWNWKIHMPAALMYNLCNDNYNWYYNTQPEPYMDDRIMYWPRGRVWGGSSALNAMVYIRGHPYDYDRWEKEGAIGWSFKNCLPYFKKSQTHNMTHGPEKFRGHDGPLHVIQGLCDNPLHRTWMEAGVQAGYGYTEDINGYRQEGVGHFDLTVYNGKRWSTSQAYLRPVLNRKNLHATSKIFVTRVLFDGNKAIGIEFVRRFTNELTLTSNPTDKKMAPRPFYFRDKFPTSHMREKVYCSGDIILAGGAINSPQLLMLSGVGPADHLKEHDIDIVHHLPGVGQNLQDHLEIYVQQACTQPVTLYDKSSWRFPHNMIRIGLQWFLTKTGEGASSHLESGGFVRSQPEVEHPDIQFHFLPSTVHDHGRKGGDQHAYQVHVGPMRPTSKGFVKLMSDDPRDHPVIQANYLSTEQDRQEFRDSIRISREIFAQKAFDPYRGQELAPGEKMQSDDDIDAFVRQYSDTAYHPSCTCKMGRSDDPMAVVDGQTLNVHGLENLKVVDASIMPSIASGNLNAPVIMMAEKAADMIQGKPPLPPENVEIWEPKDRSTNKAC